MGMRGLPPPQSQLLRFRVVVSYLEECDKFVLYVLSCNCRRTVNQFVH